MRVQASGDLPLTYRWVWNLTNTLSQGTNAMFTMTNIQFSQVGVYVVEVTNVGGAVTSAPAMLSVIPAVSRRRVPGIVLNGVAPSLLNVEYASNLDFTGWMSFPTLYFTNSPQFFFDLTTPLPAQRFYRAWRSSPVGAAPTLGIHMIPALTLTGSLGETIRVDAINQFGPTNAWFTLDAVTLMEASQLYFDVARRGSRHGCIG